MKKKKLQPNDRETANFLSLSTFWWMNSFFTKGAKKTLNEEDMLELSEKDTSRYVTDELEKNWEKELEKQRNGVKPSLGKAIIKTYASQYMKLGLLIIFEEVLYTVHPLLVAEFVGYFESMETQPVSRAYWFAAAISLLSMFLAVFHHAYSYYIQRMGWHLRAAACSLMYKKTLRLSQKSLGQTTTGQIVNLGSTDVLRFDYLPLFVHFIWIGPVMSIVSSYIIWKTVGPAVLAGMGVLFCLMIIQSLNGRAFGKLRMSTAVITDERVRIMNEIITGMRIIKMYTWEKPFARLVAEIRKREIHKIMWTAMLRSFNFSTFICTPKIMSCVTFIVYVAIGGEISPSQVFKVIGLYNVIQVSMGLFFPLAIENIAESRISIQRIEKFLLLDEIKPCNLAEETVQSTKSEYSDAHHGNPEEKEPSFVHFNEYSGKWYSNNADGESERVQTLKDINCKVKAGQLLAVIGPVGSGKSSFLNAILGELPTLSGLIEVNGKVTYASQIPWVFAGTIRENILFGEEYDPLRYNKVVKACGLTRDLMLLPNGDLTLVGERGVTLSGGQKTRVNLARAAYRRDATICLLDDPLSTVDAAVGSHLFQHCISGIMKDKVRILVTHQLQFLQDADLIIILKEGEIVGKGTYDELCTGGTDFAALLQERERPEDDIEVLSTRHFSETDDESTVFTKSTISPKIDSQMAIAHQSLSSVKSEEVKALLDEEYSQTPTSDKDDGYIAQDVTEENREEGSVDSHVYIEYFSAGVKKFFAYFFILIMVTSHVLLIICDWWISIWATEYEEYTTSTINATFSTTFSTILNVSNFSTSPLLESSVFDTGYYLMVYGVLTLATYICIVILAIMHFYICMSSGIKMHKKMLRAILRAPIRFFDTNPSGRILNRFSKDIGQIDDQLPMAYFDFLYIFGVIVSVLILAIATNYLVVIVVFPLIAYFIWLRQYYVKTLRDVKRLEGSTRSPVFSLLSSTLQGLSTVRAFRAQEAFEDKFHERQDLHSSAWYLFLCGGRWLGVRLDFLSSLFITTLSFMSLISLPIIPLDAGQVGLTLTYAFMLFGMFQWGVKQSTEVENLMTSVERVQQYYRIPPEAPDEVPSTKPPQTWPMHGVVTFDRVSFVYYKGGPNVLNRIRVNIRAQEKVGIVGRTGAGKSSLISALFRLSELSEGEILIDGVPITPLGLNDLRSSLSIIPQDPILFTGTMRRNLDPFSQYSDDDLWDALEQVQLCDVVNSLPLKLDTELAESGSNFSVGQCQLVCLARAVLRKSKILVIDEATANVDLRTDRLIQLTIHEKFKHCTVLTIAHRINTIIDSDRVLMLDAGCVKEFEEPHILLQDPESFFSQLVDSTTASEAELLRKMAKEAHMTRNEPGVNLPDNFNDKDRSYLSRFVPTPGTYDFIEFETGL